MWKKAHVAMGTCGIRKEWAHVGVSACRGIGACWEWVHVSLGVLSLSTLHTEVIRGRGIFNQASRVRIQPKLSREWLWAHVAQPQVHVDMPRVHVPLGDGELELRAYVRMPRVHVPLGSFQT